jgi:hypothetical protein
MKTASHKIKCGSNKKAILHQHYGAESIWQANRCAQLVKEFPPIYRIQTFITGWLSQWGFFFLLGYNAMLSINSQWTFQSSVLPPSTGLKSEPHRKQHEASSKQNLLQLCFISEDEGNMFLRNISWLSLANMVLCLSRWNLSLVTTAFAGAHYWSLL